MEYLYFVRGAKSAMQYVDGQGILWGQTPPPAPLNNMRCLNIKHPFSYRDISVPFGNGEWN